jgi:hypothetical protein
MRARLLLLGIFMTAASVHGNDGLKISVSPAQSMAPANLFIRVSIEPSAGNRTIAVVAESEDFYRSSQMQLEGEDGPRTVVFQFRSVPSGHYEIRGALGDARGREVALAHQNVIVIPSGAER